MKFHCVLLFVKTTSHVIIHFCKDQSYVLVDVGNVKLRKKEKRNTLTM